jgi:hypothetical protein
MARMSVRSVVESVMAKAFRKSRGPANQFRASRSAPDFGHHAIHGDLLVRQAMAPGLSEDEAFNQAFYFLVAGSIAHRGEKVPFVLAQQTEP